MDHVVGWITVKPGRREEFLARSASFVAATRAEPGLLYFSLLPDPEHPDIVVAVEGYASAETHAAHMSTPHFAEFWVLFQDLVVEGRFENMAGVTTRTDVVRPGA